MKDFFAKINTLFKKSKGAVTATLLCTAAIALIGCFFVYSAAYSKILPNIKVNGLSVSGMTAEEATSEIENAFGKLADGRDITIACDGAEKTISFSELKTQINSKKTAEKAFEIGRNGGNFKKAIKMFALAFSGEDIRVEVSVDDKKIDEIIKELTAGKELPATGTTYHLDGDKLTIAKGHGGRMVDRKKAADALSAAVSDFDKKKLELAIETLKAKPVDEKKFYDELTAPAKDATYRFEDGEVVIDAEKIGIKVDKGLVSEALKSQQNEYTLTVKTEVPEVTAAELEELLFRDVMGTYSSNFATSTQARASNVILTANRINGKILMPGDEFSYDKTIGKRTVANGYREAGVYIGNKVESGIGGGICQTSSTLYSAALYANLEIVSRTSHSLPVSYVPAGQDATIAEGYIDLKLKNNTPYPVKIVATVNGRRLTCSILGVKEPDISVEIIHTRTANYEPQLERTQNEAIPKGYKYVINEGAPGYAVASQRIVRKAGKVEKTEKLSRSVYRAAPIEEEVNPADKDTPSENLKRYTPGMTVHEEMADTKTGEQPEIQVPEEIDTEKIPDSEEEITEDEEVNV